MCASRLDKPMKALLLSKYKHLELADLPEPATAPGEVLVRVAACGICGSDVHGYDGSSGRRIPPIVMGHEAAGEIAAVGPGVTGLRAGDRVTFDSTVSCGSCAYCRRGDINLCQARQVLGVSCGDYRRAGAFAEYIAVPAHIVYPLPENLSFPEAAMLEAVAVALHAVALTNDVESCDALVVGAGMIGLLLLQVLRAAQASRIIVVDVDPSRLDLAKKLGADLTLTAGAGLARKIQETTGGQGVDVALEAVGRNETVETAIDSVRKGGTVTLVGNIAPEISLPLQKVVTRQIRLQGSCASAGEYPQAIDLMARGEVDVKSMITAVAPLAEGPQWFERLYAKEPNLLKVVLTPGAAR